MKLVIVKATLKVKKWLKSYFIRYYPRYHLIESILPMESIVWTLLYHIMWNFPSYRIWSFVSTFTISRIVWRQTTLKLFCDLKKWKHKVMKNLINKFKYDFIWVSITLTVLSDLYINFECLFVILDFWLFKIL